MKVYRYLSEAELKAIQSGDMSQIGSLYDNEQFKSINSHYYRKGVRYLHFYKNKDDVNKMKGMSFLSNGDYYICTFDIPLYILAMGYGHGYYGSHGYKVDAETATEFKIPAKHMKTKYLIDYVLDTSHRSPIDDFVYIPSFRIDPILYRDDVDVNQDTAEQSSEEMAD